MSAATNLVVIEPPPAGVSGPLIESLPPSAALVGKPIQYQVIAWSAKPSSLAFSLSASPAGMTIDAATGLLQWTPGSNQAGDQPVSIVAQDSAGQTTQSFTLSVFGSRAVASAKIPAATGGVIAVTDPSSTINGLSISIPAGALAADTTITVSELVAPPTLGGTPHFLLKGFSVDPDGTSLAVPAQITIPYSTTEFGTTQGITLEDFLGVYFVDAATGGLELQSQFSVDKTNHALTGTVPHFSVYEVTNIARLCPPLLPGDKPPLPADICPDTYTVPASLFLPTVLVHGLQLGFQLNFQLKNCPAMGNESTWGDVKLGSLRFLLKQQGIDAWRFDWDSVCTSFEKSAAVLDAALQCIEEGQPGKCPGQGSAPHLVNLVAHSFGGILARTYLEGLANASDLKTTPNLKYRKDINRVMTLGSPHSGIGGNFSIWQAKNICLLVAGVTSANSTTCSKATAGGPFMSTLNTTLLPLLGSSVTPQYDFIAGRAIFCFSSGACPFQSDDGLITTTGNQLCGTLPGGGTGFPSVCSGLSPKDFIEEINPENLNLPKNAGLCHTGFLLNLTCQSGFNIAMAAVDSESHPLWNKICTFLGGCTPVALTHTLTVASTNPSSGVRIMVSPADNNGKGDDTTQFTHTYNDGVVVTLNAPLVAVNGNNFSSWAGCNPGTGTTCTVTINSDLTVTAIYVLPSPPGQVQCAYVANQLSSSVSGYTVDPLTGKLGTVTGSPFAVVALPVSVAADPAGRFLYVANSALGNSLWISAFGINASSCALTKIGDFPPISLNFTFLAPTAVAVHPSGNFLYMTSLTGAVACFIIAPTTGALSPCAGSPAPAGLLTNSIALYPTGSFAYATNQGSANVSGYSVDFAAGNLAPVAGSPFGDACNSPGTCSPSAIALDPLGKFAYVANSDATVCVYDIDATSGMLTPRSPCFLEPNLAVAGFTWATVHKSGNFVLASAIAATGGFAAVYRVDRFTGGLSAIVGSPFVAGSGPSSITVDASGQFVYVTNGTSSSISCYAIDGNTGVLTQFDCGISQTGAQPSSIVTTVPIH